ncbi:MAG TPA: hypothetical protein VIP11_05710 [Gemmatimonadaceae bacterium]
MFPRTRRFRSAVPARRASLLLVILATLLAASQSPAQLRRSLPESLSDREFWQFFTSMSEEGGSFPSENFVSNEQQYQNVIPTLQRTLTPGGVYLGVGPEQNFTYITNLKPRMAVIFDIRRQNAMAHLMYKALFELSPTRADFVSRLFSRPLPSTLSILAKPSELFAAASAAKMSDSAYDANRLAIIDVLAVKHGFALSPADVQSINHVYAAFFEAGPEINYGYRFGSSPGFRSTFANYGYLQSLTNAHGVNMAFLANEENYLWMRGLEQKNLVIPVVGDFAGTKAIRAVGDYVRQRDGKVSAFYLSNVEQYLFRQAGDAERFYRNVESLPIDTTSHFIRSVPPDGTFGAGMVSLSPALGNPALYYSVSIVDSGGVRVIQTTRDSAGRAVTTRTIDTSRVGGSSPLEVFRTLRARDDSLMRARNDSTWRAWGTGIGAPAPSRTIFVPAPSKTILRDSTLAAGGFRSIVVGGGTLTSGIASIRAQLDAFTAGKLLSYQDVIVSTKTSGWK